MPAPEFVEFQSGRVPVREAFGVRVTGAGDQRLERAIRRFLRRWQMRTGLTFVGRIDNAGGRSAARAFEGGMLTICCEHCGPALPALGQDESYALDITAKGLTLHAAEVVGALRGLETLSQLLEEQPDGWWLPEVTIRDRSRFPWRGLLIDVSRHWQPLEVLRRNLEGMALVKFNVLHLHLTDDQGFRIECRTHPRLHTCGSDGEYFTHEQIRELVAFAADRGIRVVPEFDIPGHATSWLVGHPELGSRAGPYSLIRHWGIHDPTLDPTNEDVYVLLDAFFGEMAALFPDPYVHIGGDEVNGRHWNDNPRIQAFIRERGLGGNAGLQTWFNQRLQAILARYGRHMIGWEEILHPQLPPEAIVQSWRGPDSLAEAARRGHRGILSSGWYLNHIRPAAFHYAIDPLPAETALTPEQRARVLGGEAAMWGEWITPETIDSRIWPRAAAIAERLWSPAHVTDVDDMYRRLRWVSRRLEEAGLRHRAGSEVMIRRLAGDQASPADVDRLRIVTALVEPLKRYLRDKYQPGTRQDMPLAGLADCASPESEAARDFGGQVDACLFSSAADPAAVAAVRSTLERWRDAAEGLLRGLARRAPRVVPLVPLLQSILAAIELAGEALDHFERGVGAKDETWREAQLRKLTELGRAHGAVEIAFLTPIRRLVVAVACEAGRTEWGEHKWRRMVEEAAEPPLPDDWGFLP